jgi:electron transfer flavoprotein alpha subunit
MSDVLVVAEHRRGELRRVSYELVSAGRDLAEDLGGDLHAAVVGGDVDRFAERVGREGVDAVHTVDEGEEFNHDVYVAATAALFERLDPRVVLVPHSANGLDWAPALATRVSAPLVTDAVGLDASSDLLVTRDLYGSKVRATVEVAADAAVVTLRGGAWPAAEEPGDADVESVVVAVDDDSLRSRVRGYEEIAHHDVAAADVVIAVGRGVGSEENLEPIAALADAVDATLAASRPVVDAGWLPESRQVGQSGATVTADLYLALGIAGAPQHLAGIENAETVVAVNADPDAPIFGVADYGVVEDLSAVVAALRSRFD